MSLRSRSSQDSSGPAWTVRGLPPHDCTCGGREPIRRSQLGVCLRVRCTCGVRTWQWKGTAWRNSPHIWIRMSLLAPPVFTSSAIGCASRQDVVCSGKSSAAIWTWRQMRCGSATLEMGNPISSPFRTALQCVPCRRDARRRRSRDRQLGVDVEALPIDAADDGVANLVFCAAERTALEAFDATVVLSSICATLDQKGGLHQGGWPWHDPATGSH